MEIVIVLAPLRKHGPDPSYTEYQTLSTEVQPITGMAPILLTPAGAGLKSGLYLFRRGAYDTLKSLRSQAAAAEANIGSPRYFAQHQFCGKSWSGHSVHHLSQIGKTGVSVVKTGKDPHHYTAILPKPVTRELKKALDDVFEVFE